MKNTIMFKRSLAVGVTILFLSTAIISVAGVANFKKSSNMINGPVPNLEGNIGDNDWYVTIVLLTFSYDPERVQEIHYFHGGDWIEYNDNPVEFENDGIYSIDWKWIDELGDEHYGWPIDFKIDVTPPTIQLSKKIGTGEITFTAACSDGTSGIQLVEFYLDDELIQEDLEQPFSYSWVGSGIHEVYAIGYNFAGLSKVSNILDTTPRAKTVNFQLLEILIQRMYYLFLIIQQINLF